MLSVPTLVPVQDKKDMKRGGNRLVKVSKYFIHC